MKKIYNSPEMDIIELKQQQTLLAGSVTFSVTNDVIPANEVDAPIFSDDLPIFGEDGLVEFAE
jgi:hypothetical protein